MQKHLIRDAQNGDRRSFELLVKQYDRQVYALIYRFVSDRDKANDVYQDVFMTVYKNLKSFSFKSEFYTWLYRITVNCALNKIQKEKKHKNEDIDQMQIQSKENQSQSLVSDILTLAKDLPEKQRIVFFMRFQNDLKLSEIASALNIDLGTVKGYLSRSIKKIRHHLELG